MIESEQWQLEYFVYYTELGDFVPGEQQGGMVNATIILGVALILGGAIVSLSGIGFLIGLPMILLGILLIALRASLSTVWSMLTPNS